MMLPKLPNNKFIRIFIYLILAGFAIRFLPFIIGGLLSLLVYKKINQTKIRYALITCIFLPSLILGYAWNYGFTHPVAPTKQIKEEVKSAQISITSTTIIPTEKPTLEPVNQTIIPEKILYNVRRVVDGDTIDVENNGKIQRIRLIGINTPEIVDPRKPVECFGKEASDKAKEILKGKKVSLEEDRTQDDKDQYGRFLRYVILEDGTSFNKLMIIQGYAYEYTYDFPYKYQSEFKRAEQEARDNKRGLWADDACVTPTPTKKPTTAPTKYIAPTTNIIQYVPPTATPYQQYVPPTSTPAPIKQAVQTPANNSGSYNCDCGRTCTQISSCAEAQYQLNSCGCNQRDADHDGIACDSAPLHCQN